METELAPDGGMWTPFPSGVGIVCEETRVLPKVGAVTECHVGVRGLSTPGPGNCTAKGWVYQQALHSRTKQTTQATSSAPRSRARCVQQLSSGECAMANGGWWYMSGQVVTETEGVGGPDMLLLQQLSPKKSRIIGELLSENTPPGDPRTTQPESICS